MNKDRLSDIKLDLMYSVGDLGDDYEALKSRVNLFGINGNTDQGISKWISKMERDLRNFKEEYQSAVEEVESAQK